jgi:hypothetical protein
MRTSGASRCGPARARTPSRRASSSRAACSSPSWASCRPSSAPTSTRSTNPRPSSAPSRTSTEHPSAHHHHHRTRTHTLATTAHALFFGDLTRVSCCVSCRRECISVGVLYLGKGQTKKKVWANSAEHVSRSPAYQRFLDASGWTVRLADTLIPHIPTFLAPCIPHHLRPVDRWTWRRIRAGWASWTERARPAHAPYTTPTTTRRCVIGSASSPCGMR